MSFFYIVSKVFNFFLNPMHWIIILLLIMFFTKKRLVKRKLRIAVVIIFLLFTNKALLNLVVNNWQPPRVNLYNKSYSAGIVLGGMAVVDKNQRGYMWWSSDRFIQTIELYKQGNIKKIIISGGSLAHELPREADFVKDEMIKCGIPASDIFAENLSANTFENASFSKRIIDSIGLHPPYVLITSAMHMPRASRVFNKAGLYVIPYPGNYEIVEEHLTFDDYIVPKIYLVDIWARFLKEITGIWVYRITGKA